MKKVVITGASGFIGMAFTRYLLEQEYYVIAVVRNKEKLSNLTHKNLKVVELAFEQYKSLSVMIAEADMFYHFAWEWDGAYGKKTVDYEVQLNNVSAACCAIEQAVKMGCKKFILAGTVAELEIREMLDENVCSPRVTCVYAAAKMNAELLCKTIAKQYGIEFNCGLLANIIGPGDYSHRSTNSILNMFIHGNEPKLVKGEGLNDWLYIADAVRLIEAMGNKGVNMKTYYIGHNELWSFRTIIERARNVVNPSISLHFGVIPDDFLTNYRYVNTDELYRDTNCRAEYDFEEAVRKTAEWVESLGWSE